MASSLLQQLLSLLLLLLPSPLRLREHLSGNHAVSANNFHPIFLVAGMSCSDLEARLTEEYRPSVPHCGAMKGKGWFGLDWCLGKLRAALEDMGYRDGDTMFGAPYDFRYAPPSPGQTSEVYSRYFKELMELVEAASERTRKKAVILGHSFGGMVALEFVRNTPPAWRSEHIERLVLVAPTLPGGFLEPVRNFASGTDILYVPATTPLATRAMWRSFESAIVNFPSPAVFGRLQAPLVVTRERNYSASAQDMERFLAAVGSGEAAEPFRRRAVPKMSSFAAPMVPMTYISGVGNRTPLRLVFWGDDFDAAPEAVAYGDGDGKINSISGLAFEKEMRRQPEQKKQFKSIKINKAQHSTIVTDDFALHRVIQEIVEANNQKIPS
ncbi:Lecithin-cholesterol acyltransferase-like 1 [Zea mays]|uniref:Lecithin-cholesterol acyltransferase-like 1 n=1 Tax=Zea mays TaxID=4577 RepID=A0A1D6EM85_MAIZE|nr:Lecithin-cholesterol acyltransferase-like 1 [Zea mays]